MYYERRNRLLSTSNLYVDVEKDLRDIANDVFKDDDDCDKDFRWSLRHLRSEFKTKDNEKLWHKYQARLRHRLLCVLLIINVCATVLEITWHSIGETFDQFPYSLLFRLTSLTVYVSFIVLVCHSERWLTPKFSQFMAAAIVFAAMLFAEFGGIVLTLSGDYAAFSWKKLSPVFYLIICNEILLPFPSRIYSSFGTVLIVVLEITISSFWPQIDKTSCESLSLPKGTRYFIADLVFYVFASLVAYFITFLLEIVNRRAFLDHRRCVESKFKLNFERDQQEQLLNSCLPKHLIQKVREDLRERFDEHHDVHNPNTISRPFTELYIEKHKNVTILFADIVNSMLLGQSFSPKELVETLNELYGKFDVRAEANNCMRIKLLGDCYYCVSGIPEFDPKHALNCINMGLDMIDIIRTLREESKINIDMRIGVHSGTILSGLLGLCKWQFDIWSTDTMRASQLEHSGRAGFVHVSQETLKLIPERNKLRFAIQAVNQNQLEIQETSYLISKSLFARQTEKVYTKNKPPKSPTDHKQLVRFHYPLSLRNSSLSGRSSRIESIHFSRRRTVLEVCLGKYREMLIFAHQYLSKAIDKMPLSIKGQYTSSRHQSELQPFFLNFVKNKNKAKSELSSKGLFKNWNFKNEKLYVSESDPLFRFYLVGSALIGLAMIGIRSLTLYKVHLNHVDLTISNSICAVNLIILVVCFLYANFSKHKLNYYSRITIWSIVSSSLATSCIIDLLSCDGLDAILNNERNERGDERRNSANDCLVKWTRYYTFLCVLALANIHLFMRINLWLKFLFSTSTLICINFVALFHPCSVFQKISELSKTTEDQRLYTPFLTHLHYLFVVYLLLHVIDRQIEYIFRLDFLWTQRLKSERREAQITMEINHLLLRNILPVHVAQRYLYNSQDPGEQLYYEAYHCCGVMFAAIPNFNLFSGAEVDDDLKLKTLNEIICEFDKLLMLPQFGEKVEKIKTIGSTYMAATGLQPGRGEFEMGDEDEATNVIALVKYALAMFECLDKINSRKSQDFKLRVGIALGPVIAGVVGAVKPQYDVWSDTVNVASRMDTSGIEGYIHVTQEVARILLDNNLFCLVCRGAVNIKGKGQLVTYLIDGQQKSISR